ncbi:MAG: hypothetical protein ABIG03_06175 [Candidatus Eisenbacteria bacterium]
MKYVAIVASLLLAVALVASAGHPVTQVYEEKKLSPHPAPGDGREGGETIGTAWVIPSLPYDDTGDTSDNIDDYDEVCPYTGSTSPDVVYVFTAPYNMTVDILTCNSLYDTKLYVYENMYTPGAFYACNDDNAACDGLSYRSWIEGLYLAAGNNYYIVVDGYGGDGGPYEFHMYEVEPPIPCTPLCPNGAYIEGEPLCGPDYDDTYNGGCNSTVPVFQSIPAAPYLAICGETGVFPFGASTYRETDWFEVVLTEDRQVTLRMCSAYPMVFGFIEAALYPGCTGTIYIDPYALSEAYFVEELTAFLTAGTWWIFASTADWGDCPCGTEYVLEVEGTSYSPVEETTWTTIKALYH